MIERVRRPVNSPPATNPNISKAILRDGCWGFGGGGFVALTVTEVEPVSKNNACVM